MSKSCLKVLLVEGHELIRSGLRMRLESTNTVESVFEAPSLEVALRQILEHSIDLVFMDMELPGIDGFSSALQMLKPKDRTKIILLAGVVKPPLARVSLKAGIAAYVSTSRIDVELSQALNSVMRGEKYLSKDLEEQVALDTRKKESIVRRLNNLSRREFQVALLLMHGYKPGDVSDMLLLNAKTVSTYKRRAFEKLEVQSMVQLLEFGLDQGFLGQNS